MRLSSFASSGANLGISHRRCRKPFYTKDAGNRPIIRQTNGRSSDFRVLSLWAGAHGGASFYVVHSNRLLQIDQVRHDHCNLSHDFGLPTRGAGIEGRLPEHGDEELRTRDLKKDERGSHAQYIDYHRGSHLPQTTDLCFPSSLSHLPPYSAWLRRTAWP